MNEVLNSGAINLASIVLSLVVLLVGLVLWFFINRASSRTNEQIELLEALLDLSLIHSDAADERSSVDLGGRRIIKKKKKKRRHL